MIGTSARILVGAKIKGFVDEDVALSIPTMASAPLIVAPLSSPAP